MTDKSLIINSNIFVISSSTWFDVPLGAKWRVGSENSALHSVENLPNLGNCPHPKGIGNVRGTPIFNTNLNRAVTRILPLWKANLLLRVNIATYVELLFPERVFP